MSAPSLPEIVDEILEGISPLVRVDRQRLASNTRGDLVNLLVLKGFPQVVRNVEHDTLKKVWVAAKKNSTVLVGSMESSTWRKRTKGTH